VVLKYMRSCRGGPLDCRDNTVFEKLMAGGLAGMVRYIRCRDTCHVRVVVGVRVGLCVRAWVCVSVLAVACTPYQTATVPVCI
jgi:hypothetical protein